MSVLYPYFLHCALVLFGFSAIVCQVLFFRELLVAARGNELIIGVIFFCWFIGITAGALTASLRKKGTPLPLHGIVFLLVLQVVLAPFLLLLIRAINLVLGTPVGELIPFIHICLGVLFVLVPFSFLTGLIFPFLCSHVSQEKRHKDTSIGKVYYLESFGSIVGGLACTFLLVSHVHNFSTLACLGLIVSLNGGLVLLTQPGEKRKFTSAVPFIISIVFLLSLALRIDVTVEKKSEELRWWNVSKTLEMEDTTDTSYQHLALGFLAGQYSLFSNGQHVADFPDEYGNALRAFFVLSQHPDPKHILVLGGGNEGVLKYLLKYDPVRIDCVETDRELLPFIKHYLQKDAEMKEVLKSDVVRFYHMDGRTFVKQKAYEAVMTTGKGVEPRFSYDLVLINMPEPSTAVINRFYTIEFFRELKHIVADNAVVSCSLSSAVNYFGEDVSHYVGSVYRTLKSVFPHVVVTPGTTAHLFASGREKIVSTNPEILRKRLEEKHIETEYFSPLVFYSLLPAQKVALTRHAMETAEKTVPLNTDLHPVTYLYNLILWARFSGSKMNAVFRTVLDLTLGKVLTVIGLLLVLRCVYTLWKKPPVTRRLRFATLYLIGVTGFAGMSAEIILLYLFQNIFGYVYHQIGVIVACFMIGLTAGAFLATKINVHRERTLFFVLLGVDAMFLLFLLGLILGIPLLVDTAGTIVGGRWIEVFLYGAMLLTGGFAGLEFPLVGRLLTMLDLKVTISAGFVDAADHFGAALGALLVGVALVPVLGIRDALLVTLILKLTGMIFLLDFREYYPSGSHIT